MSLVKLRSIFGRLAADAPVGVLYWQAGRSVRNELDRLLELDYPDFYRVGSRNGVVADAAGLASAQELRIELVVDDGQQSAVYARRRDMAVLAQLENSPAIVGDDRMLVVAGGGCVSIAGRNEHSTLLKTAQELKDAICLLREYSGDGMFVGYYQRNEPEMPHGSYRSGAPRQP